MSAFYFETQRATRILTLVGTEDETTAINILYRGVREYIEAGRFGAIEELVELAVPAISKSPSFAVAVLTATLPVKSRIRNRSTFYAAIEDHLVSIGVVPEVVLHGLA
jgi:hypothetical protein